jgi:hypothetical protein
LEAHKDKRAEIPGHRLLRWQCWRHHQQQHQLERLHQAAFVLISLGFCHTFLIDLDLPVAKLGAIFFGRILEAISHSFFDGCRVNRLLTKDSSEN